MENKKFLTVEEVAAEFGIDEATLGKFVEDGSVQRLADRGTWKFRRDELQSLLDSGKISPPVAELWMDDSDSEKTNLTSGGPVVDDLSFLELDEVALDQQASADAAASRHEDRTPVDGIGIADDWFSPSSADEMNTVPTDAQQSSSDVSVWLGDDEASANDNVVTSEAVGGSGSDSDVRLGGVVHRSADDEKTISMSALADSDSDVRIADTVGEGLPGESGIVLDFDVGSGATVSSSGSSLRLPQIGSIDDAFAIGEEMSEQESGEDSGITLSDAVPQSEGGSSLRLGDDSNIELFGIEGSGIALEGGSHLGMVPTGSSMLTGARREKGGLADDSDITLQDVGDSGLALEAFEDSGVSLETPQGNSNNSTGSGASVFDDDSGIRLSSMDSGLSLEAPGDSGLTLEADSGLALESMADSGLSLDKTLADGELATTMFDDPAAATQTFNVSDELDDDSAFDISFGESPQTTELLFEDDADTDETAATVVKKGRGQSSPGLTEAFKLDDQDVEDLEISEDLDAATIISDGFDDVEVAEAEPDEVFEASEETFSDEVEALDDEDEETLGAVDESIRPRAQEGPREPSWGAGMSIGLIACSLVLVANALVVWAGVSTMWSGAEADGPASAIIAQLAGLIQ